MKRVMDFVLALAAMAVLAPLMLTIWIAIRMSIGGPAFFRQERPGLDRKPLLLVKFRTMTEERGTRGDLLPDEVRLTRLGRFLRRTSLDELPELWNVLKGDMSLVGPRPLLMEYLPLYTEEQTRRHEVRPGITGWAQVKGRNQLSWEERLRLDVWYVDNRSFRLDLKILVLTVWKVLKGEGISQPGQATMERFGGSGHGGKVRYFEDE